MNSLTAGFTDGAEVKGSFLKFNFSFLAEYQTGYKDREQKN